MGVMFFAVLGATWFLYQKVPKGFIPDADNDQMQLNIQAAQGTSFYKMVEYQKSIADIVRKDPDVDAFMTNAGNGNSARFFVMLRAHPERKSTAQQVAERLRPKIASIPGIQRLSECSAAHPHRRRRFQFAQQLRFHAARSRHGRVV